MTKEDAIIDLAAELGLPDPFGGEWDLTLDTDDVLEHVLPRKPFGSGFFAADPFYPIASQMPNPQPLAEGAEEAGMPAGGSMINTGNVSGGGTGGSAGGHSNPCAGGCSTVCLQNSVAAGVDAFLADPTIGVAGAAAKDSEVWYGLAGCCFPRSWRTTPVPGPWTCGPWVFQYSSPGGMAGKNCHYIRNTTRTVSRGYTRRCLDCTMIIITQTATETSTQTGRVTVAAGDPCPAGGPVGLACAPTGSISRGAWTPGPPACP